MQKRGREREGCEGGGAIEALFVPDAGALRRNHEGLLEERQMDVSVKGRKYFKNIYL